MANSFLILTLLIILIWEVYGQDPTKPCKMTSVSPSTTTNMSSGTTDVTEKCWTKIEYEGAIRNKTINKVNETCDPEAQKNVSTIWDFISSFNGNHTFSGVSESTIRMSCNTLEDHFVCPDSNGKCTCARTHFYNETLDMCQMDSNATKGDQMEIKNLLLQIENMSGWRYINESCEAGLKPQFDRRIHGLRDIANGRIKIKEGQCLFSKNLVCESDTNDTKAADVSQNGTCQCSLSTEWQPHPNDPTNLRRGICAAEDGRSCELRYSLISGESIKVPIQIPCFNKNATCTESLEEESDDVYYVCCIPGMAESEDDICRNGQPEVKTKIWKVIGILSGVIVVWSGMFG